MNVFVILLLFAASRAELPTIRILWRDSYPCNEMQRIVQNYTKATVIVDCKKPESTYFGKEFTLG